MRIKNDDSEEELLIKTQSQLIQEIIRADKIDETKDRLKKKDILTEKIVIVQVYIEENLNSGIEKSEIQSERNEDKIKPERKKTLS